MSTTCRRLKSPQYIRPPHHGHTSLHQGHKWMNHILFVLCKSAVPFLRLAYLKHWHWNSKVKVIGVVKGWVIQWAQYSLTLLPFHFTSIRPAIPEIQLFRNVTLKHPRSRSWVRSKVKVTYNTQYPKDSFPFCFTSIVPTIPEIWAK